MIPWVEIAQIGADEVTIQTSAHPGNRAGLKTAQLIPARLARPKFHALQLQVFQIPIGAVIQ